MKHGGAETSFADAWGNVERYTVLTGPPDATLVEERCDGLHRLSVV